MQETFVLRLNLSLTCNARQVEPKMSGACCSCSGSCDSQNNFQGTGKLSVKVLWDIWPRPNGSAEATTVALENTLNAARVELLLSS